MKTVVHLCAAKQTGKDTLANEIRNHNVVAVTSSTEDYDWNGDEKEAKFKRRKWLAFTKCHEIGEQYWEKIQSLCNNPEQEEKDQDFILLAYAKNLKTQVHDFLDLQVLSNGYYDFLLSYDKLELNRTAFNAIVCIILFLMSYQLSNYHLSIFMTIVMIFYWKVHNYMSLEHKSFNTLNHYLLLNAQLSEEEIWNLVKDKGAYFCIDFSRIITHKKGFLDVGLRYQTLREYYIEYGMKKREKEGVNYWAKQVTHQILSYDDHDDKSNFIITDFRFPSEIQTCENELDAKEYQHISVRLYRPLLNKSVDSAIDQDKDDFVLFFSFFDIAHFLLMMLLFMGRYYEEGFYYLVVVNILWWTLMYKVISGRILSWLSRFFWRNFQEDDYEEEEEQHKQSQKDQSETSLNDYQCDILLVDSNESFEIYAKGFPQYQSYIQRGTLLF